MHLFLYTKCNSAKFFGDLGFYEIVRVDGQIVFMENRKTGFSGYLEKLKKETCECKAYTDLANADKRCLTGHAAASTDGSGTSDPFISALVMNANPFTLGHQYLVETAAASCDLLHLFIVSEDSSLVPFSVRKKLVMEGTAHLSNICYHESGPYIISSATFPSYFQKDETAVIESHARLDLAVFTRISEALGITCRYVGEEPTSLVTSMYNEIMAAELPKADIQCRIIPRKEANGKPISASTVRQCLKDGDMETLKTLVPETTLRYFESPEAAPVIEKIRAEANVIHY
jgi:[citrate (pro-3S)-lyase] ligase